jgi:hypothetical protein
MAVTLESYLVSLGFQVDTTSLRRWEDALTRLSETVEKHTSNPLTGIGGMFVKTGGMILGTLGALEAATVGVAFHTANMDLNMQIAARRMFMETGKFRDMKTALDALGVSMEDVMFGPPELRERYGVLMKDESRMGLDANWEKQMRRMRDVEFQFTRLQMIFERGFIPEFVGSLSKQLFGDQGDLEHNLDMFNEKFIKHLPEWSDWLAGKIVPIIKETIKLIGTDIPNAVAAVLPGILDIYDRLKILWDLAKEAYNWTKSVTGGISPQMGNLHQMQENARQLAMAHGLDPNLVEGLIAHESAWNPTAKNDKSGAYGLMQLMPKNMHAFGLHGEDPMQNLEIGIRLLEQYLKNAHGDVYRGLQPYGGFLSQDKIKNEYPGYYADIMRRAEEYKADPFKPMSGQQSVGAPSIHTQVTVHVDGSKDAHEIGHVVAEKVSEELAKSMQRVLVEMGGVYA